MTVKTWSRSAASLVGLAVLAVPMTLLSGAPAHARPPAAEYVALRAPARPAPAAEAACANRTQIGSTAYIKIGGETFASVKQFKGCGKNWAYAYVWESYRNSHSKWDICISVAAKRSNNRYDLVDLVCAASDRQVELWSAGASTLAQCTHAVGWWPHKASARTDDRC